MTSPAARSETSPATSLGDFKATRIDGSEISLADYEGQVVLVVNTASKCGFTEQYEGLQELQDTFGDRGFTVLGFPCNQFGNQEPGSEEEIADFCERTFSVTFPMFAKVDVNGENAHPLFAWLRSQQSGLLGDKIKWNFTKFLIGRDGAVIDRSGPMTIPARLTDRIEAAL